MRVESAACRFCDIIRGEVHAWRVFEDDLSIAFLDSRPLFPGHTLLVPREHVGTLVELREELVGPFFTNARLLARGVESAARAEGTFIAINNRVSQSIPHLHIHIVPRRRNDGLRGFFWPRHPYPDEASANAMKEAVRKAIACARG